MAVNVLVAIGGTGARVAEAYVYAAASGLLANNTKTLIFVVDKDIHCGNTMRLTKTINAYRDMRVCTGLDLPDIESCTWLVQDAMDQLSSGVGNGNSVTYGQVASIPGTDASTLVNFLHSKEEQDFDLDLGFYGHPSLGAALYGMITQTPVFATSANTLVDKIRNELSSTDGSVNTYIVGSMFGGTGASLLPNVASTLHRDPKIGANANYHQAACLMLPYFMFQPNSGDGAAPVSFASFDEKTATALKFYAAEPNFVRCDNKPRGAEGHNEAVFDNVYLFGRKPLEPTCPTYTLGGKDQVHTFTVVDYYAGLAAVEFFNGKTALVPEGAPHLYSADMPTPCVRWPQVPNPYAQQGSEQMLRFCYAFLKVLYPMFSQPNTFLQKQIFLGHIYGSSGFAGMGHANLPEGMDFGAEVDRIAPFCESYMRFFVNLHQCNTTVHPDSVELFTPVLANEHMTLISTEDTLMPRAWFQQEYRNILPSFRPDDILLGDRHTAIRDAASLQNALTRYKFDLNAYPGMKSIYRAAYEIMHT